MKTKPDPKPRLENIIRALILTFHLITPVICRPQSHGHHPSSSSSSQSGSNRTHHSPHSFDQNITDTMAKFGDGRNPHRNNIHAPLDNPIDLRAVSLKRFYHNTRPIDGDSNDSHLSRDDYVSVGGSSLVDAFPANGTIHSDASGDVTYGLEEDAGTTHGDVYYAASDGFEEEEERNFQGYVDTTVHLGQADANEVAKSSSPSRIWKRRRQRSSPNRWRRRHRLLLKTRDSKEHLRRRDRFLLKADGPGHVIFKAGEVKKDWCRTIPFEQNVTAGRCSKTVRNNLCYGQCNSFFIPQSEKGSNKVAFQSFSFCKPHRLRWVNVTLDCPSGRHSPKIVQKTILKVESCRCIAADSNEMNKNLEYLRKGAKSIRVNQ